MDDAARGICLDTEAHDGPEPVNLGSGREIAIGDLAALIAEKTGFRGRLVWDPDWPTSCDPLEEALKAHNKTYEFHRYPGAGHGFFYYHRPSYRQQQAVDGWQKIFAFLAKYLGTQG